MPSCARVCWIRNTAKRVTDVLAEFEGYMNSDDTWVTREAPELANRRVAYFSAEFGLHETLPIAAGGLGVLAGGPHQERQRSWPELLWHHSFLSRRLFSSKPSITTNWQAEYYNQL